MTTKKNEKVSNSKLNGSTINNIKSVEDKHEPVEILKDIEGKFPIVGIGASAGGLAAFESFFSGIPTDVNPNMAFVLVQHLSPDHKSLLTELIQTYTEMLVVEVTDGIKVQPNCIYIIPPGKDMAFLNGTLQIFEPSLPRGQRLPIDFFFRSLAEDLRERAIGIILSGTGSDGTVGVRAIKGVGGMVMAQSIESAEYDGMPTSAIATGMVDFTLSPDQMLNQLKLYVTHFFGKLSKASLSIVDVKDNALKKIFVLLRNQTGNDFSHYKPSTILRRIDRRMAVNQIDALEDYVKFMQNTAEEVESLFHDLLIGVTNFFRDPDAFKVLEEQVISKIVAGKESGGTIRIWIVGCSTGEEAYSIAILIQEALDKLKRNYIVQIFATDVDPRAISAARKGVYSASISADMSSDRLSQFFTAEKGDTTYRVRKNIRDMVIFSEQNVIKDPPFSRLDLISCRNMMIYMDGELQKKLIPLFHYALNEDGMLLLGTSETVGEHNTLFSAIDRKSKIYQRKDEFQTKKVHSLSRDISASELVKSTPHIKAIKPVSSPRFTLRDLTEKTIIEHVNLVAVLVTEEWQILYVHGQTGKYFELSTGTFENLDIISMARDGLRRDLTIALHKAKNKKIIVNTMGLLVKSHGCTTVVNLTIRPVETHKSRDHESKLYMILLEEAINLDNEGEKFDGLKALTLTSDSEIEINPEIERLRRELHMKEEYLQSTNEELETSNEELKSSNEEMQSVNEELQSTNEELETSKEELQSVNEELATVNFELQNKVADLSQVNNDMNNFLAGTGIATIFVNDKLCIMRFNPAAIEIINLITTDIGRPVGHVLTNLIDYNSLVEDLKTVLDTLVPIEMEVQTIESKWFTLRIKPYRTLENHIEGLVISFVEITEVVKTRELLEAANNKIRLAIVVKDSRDAITVQNLEGQIIAWNPAAERIYGWTESEALQMNIRDCIPQKGGVEELSMLHTLASADRLEPYLTQRLTKDGNKLEIWMNATALVDENGEKYGISTIERVNE